MLTGILQEVSKARGRRLQQLCVLRLGSVNQLFSERTSCVLANRMLYVCRILTLSPRGIPPRGDLRTLAYRLGGDGTAAPPTASDRADNSGGNSTYNEKGPQESD